jgi:hypothetical protein
VLHTGILNAVSNRLRRCQDDPDTEQPDLVASRDMFGWDAIFSVLPGKCPYNASIKPRSLPVHRSFYHPMLTAHILTAKSSNLPKNRFKLQIRVCSPLDHGQAQGCLSTAN